MPSLLKNDYLIKILTYRISIKSRRILAILALFLQKEA